MKKDYFLGCLSLLQKEDVITWIRPEISKLIKADVSNYREYMIKQYNNDLSKATDEFSFRKFLNEYATAINIFELHHEYNCKRQFNTFINTCWQLINGNFE